MLNQILTEIFAITACLAFSGCIGFHSAGTDSHEKQEHVSQEFLNNMSDSKEHSEISQVAENNQEFLGKAETSRSFKEVAASLTAGNQKVSGVFISAADAFALVSDKSLYNCQINPASCSRLPVQLPSIESQAFCPASSLVALSYKNTLVVNNLITSKQEGRLDNLQENISTLGFVTDCQSILIGTVSGRVYHWKFKSQSLDITNPWLTAYQGQNSVISKLLMHNASRLFFSLDWSGGFYAWLTYENSADHLKDNQNPFWPRFWLEDASKVQKKLPVPADDIFQSTDGEQLVIKTKEGRLQSWQVRGFEMKCQTSKDFKIRKIRATQNFPEFIISDGLDNLYLAKLNTEIHKEGADCELEKKAISLPGAVLIRAFETSKSGELIVLTDNNILIIKN